MPIVMLSFACVLICVSEAIYRYPRVENPTLYVKLKSHPVTFEVCAPILSKIFKGQ